MLEIHNCLVLDMFDLDSCETGTVRRRAKTIVTPKMAMESFRLSFLNDDQDVNFDAILGELYELESQLNSTQTELSRSLAVGGHHPPPPAAFQDGNGQDKSDTAHVSEQEELDELATEITRGLHYHKTNGHYHHHHRHHHHGMPGSGICGGDGFCDAAETDSAFSDNISLPSSESLTSMVTVSSSADTNSSSSGETCSMSSAVCGINHSEAEQVARVKAEKIRRALEKIKEAKIRKLFVRAFAKDGSSKSILVDEKMTVAQICIQLAIKNHMRLNHELSVVEMLPDLLMERILEDHDSLVENMVMWTRDSKNKIMFEERADKYDVFKNPEKYLLSPTASKQGPLEPEQKENLIQELFAPDSISVPTVEGTLYLKSDGKKAWKKFYFVLRASGLYYNPKGKTGKNPKDLVCLVQFEYVETYRGMGWKKKYHAPTDYCFALKHPQIQKKTSKYIRYFCSETEASLDQWVMGIRMVKLGKQMFNNYQLLTHEISMWDLRQPDSGPPSSDDSLCQMLNHADLNGSQMSVPDLDTHGPVVSPPQLYSSSAGETAARDAMQIEVLAIPPCKSAEYVGSAEGRSLSGSSSASFGVSESGHKTPVKRVSFSATHSIINGDSGERTIEQRDSIISASTDSSEDSNSSGEMRFGTNLRGKMRPKLPVTTETTRQLADMCNVSIDEATENIYAETHHRSSQVGFSRSDRKRSSMQERRGSGGSTGSDSSQRSTHMKNLPLSSTHRQLSLDSGSEVYVVHGRQASPSPGGHYQHIRRKSEPLVVPQASNGKEDQTYSCIYSPLREEPSLPGEIDPGFSCENDKVLAEPLYSQSLSPSSDHSSNVSNDLLCPAAIPPPPEFRETVDDSNHIRPSLSCHEEFPPPPGPPVHVQSIKVPPPPPPPTSSAAQSAESLQKLHHPKDPHNTTAANNSKTAPPPTLPKPQSSPASCNNTTQPPPVLPKQPPPPPPIRLSSNESTSSVKHESDNVSGLLPHAANSSPALSLTTKQPPPTLPKTSHPVLVASASIVGNSIKSTSSSSSKQQSDDGQARDQNNLHVQPQTMQSGENRSLSNEVNEHTQHSSSPSHASCELSKETDPGADISDVELRNGYPASPSRQNHNTVSSGTIPGKPEKKSVPPPPPKRSESTRLSGDLARQQQQQVETTHNGIIIPVPDPIYENFDGIMDIDELPPPPPELLMDLQPTECEYQTGSARRSKPPPPPPKRSKETQLSSH